MAKNRPKIYTASMGKTLGTYNKRVHESPAARQRAKAFKDKSQIDARNALKGKMGTNLFGNKRYYPMGLVKSMPGTMAKRFQKYGIMTLKAPPKANLNSI